MQILISYICVYIYVCVCVYLQTFLNVSKAKKNRKSRFHVSFRFAYPFLFPCNLASHRLSSRQTLVSNGRIFQVPWHNMSRAHLPNLTLQMIHHDSPHPALYNPLDTVSDVLNSAFFRSISCSRLYSTKTDLKCGPVSNGSKYSVLDQQP